MDPLLAPPRPPEPVCTPAERAPTDRAAAAAEPAEGSAQTILDAWLRQLQTDHSDGPVVENRLDIDNMFSNEFEFDLDFLAELSNLKPGSGDGGATLHELSQDPDLGLLCPTGALGLDMAAPVDLGSLSGHDLFPEDPLPAAAAAPADGPPRLPESEPRPPAGPPRPPRPPPVASISVVTNKRRGKTVITISTPRGRQAFVLPTADLTQASRVLRALQRKRSGGARPPLPPPADEQPPSTPADRQKRKKRGVKEKRMRLKMEAKKISGAAAEDDDPVMSAAIQHLGVDLSRVELRPGSGAADWLFVCPLPGCQDTFQLLFKLKVHVLQHSNYRPYKCDEEGCKWQFYERGKLNRHKATHEKAFLKCDHPGCPAAFRTRTNMHRHVARIHNSATPTLRPDGDEPAAAGDDAKSGFRCALCPRSFKRASELKRHVNCHTVPGTRLSCPAPGCDHVASSRSQLKLHERQHSEKQYKCTFPECSWAFHTHAKLKRHLSQHTGRRNYPCPYAGCEKSYRRMEYLSSHVRLHLGRYYQCPQKGCVLRFSHQFSLASHMRSAHAPPPSEGSGPLSAACPLCGARFKSEIYRQIHLQDVHGTSTSKLLNPESAEPGDDEARLEKKNRKAKFNPESLNWVEDAESAADAETLTVYVPFNVETDAGPSEVLVKCDVTEDECQRLGIELEPETFGGGPDDPAPADGRLVPAGSTVRDTARHLRRMGVGVLSAGLRRSSQSGCARTDVTSCHLAVRRCRRGRPPAARPRRPGAAPRGAAELADAAGGPLRPGVAAFEPGFGTELAGCRPALEPISMLGESYLLGLVGDQLPASTINLSDLT